MIACSFQHFPEPRQGEHRPYAAIIYTWCSSGFSSFQHQNMSDLSEWEVAIQGNFPIHKAIVGGKHALEGHRSARIDAKIAVMPRGTKVVSAESYGISTWTKNAKVCVILPDGSRKRYFLKVNQSQSSWIDASC